MRPVRSAPLVMLIAGLLSTGACASGGAAGTSTTRGAPASINEQASDESQPIEVRLQRRAPGLNVVRTQSGWIAVKPRVQSSLNGLNSPLFMLNGNPFSPGPEGELTGIDPDEIETLKFVRPSESAIYGSNAINGVVLITTKKPPVRPRP